jgi:hypothetical protein
MISGFIIQGNAAKPVVMRGLGPSLVNSGVPASLVLNDPVLELHGSNGSLITKNDNWKDSPQRSQIEGTIFQPTDDREAAILANLPPGNYTAILSGFGQTAGIGLVEIYDNNQALDSDLANSSGRGFVDTGDNVIIAGFIIGPATNDSAQVLVRAIGPSLSGSGIQAVLQDPLLELHDLNGATIATNDNWKVADTGGSQQTQIEATTIPPTDDRESALVRILAPGNYTAIVRGKNATTGIGLVEVYNLK